MPDTKRTASGVLGGLAGLVGLSAVAGILIAATVTPAVALTGTAAERALTMFDNLPSVLDIEKLMLPTTFWTTNPDTGEYQELTKFYDQNRSPVDFDQIAPVMYDAILSSEDPRYYQHGGVDLIGTTRAVLSNMRGGGEVQGGSSISQQYVKNILIQDCEREAEAYELTDESGAAVLDENGDPVVVTREEALLNCWSAATTAEENEGIKRKLQEMRYAIALEQKYSKNDILLGYLNIANFGGTTYGIDAAARYYFGVSAADLTVSQAATLAGIVQNPNTYRIDKVGGSILGSDGETWYNKDPDGLIDDVRDGQLAALDTMLAAGKITDEQYLAAADGYSSTKGRQLYVLSRMLDDGKITQEQYETAVIEPITPKITAPKVGCANATGAEYFCQYARMVVEKDPAFGETWDERVKNLRQGGLNVYLTLDWRLQNAARDTVSQYAPTSIPDMKFGTSAVSVETGTGRVLSIAQNTLFRDGESSDPSYTGIVYAGDLDYGGSIGFAAGSTFKLFTLIDWLEQGKSVNQVVNGSVRPPKRMTNSCTGDWVNNSNPLWKPNNFGEGGGQISTPMQFTRQSLNSGFIAMATELDLCDIAKDVKKMGVTYGNGPDIEMRNANDIIGSANVSPLAMAGAYATVASNGKYCQPQVIDKVTDSDGNELPKPERTCADVLDPKVAATAASALQGVMNGGTGNRANPYDGVPVLGKTGTHEYWQTWMIESSTKVATAVWVGNADGEVRMDRTWHNGDTINNLRYPIARQIQAAANAAYGGNQFPAPDANLTRQVLLDLPNVVGLSLADATQRLNDLGFEVSEGKKVISDLPKGVVAAQDPPAGKIAGGSVITLSPSNGQGITVPDVSGQSLDDAKRSLRGAGFGNVVDGRCSQEDGVGGQRATDTSPRAGEVVNRNTEIRVGYVSDNCGGSPGGGGDNGNDD